MTTYQQVEIRARELGFTSYLHYLRKSPQWSDLKKQVKRCTSCCVCSSGNRNLLVAHHIRYRNLDDVQPSDLAVMCNLCHDDFHMACRKQQIDYLNLEIPRIVEIVMAFRNTPWYVHRALRLSGKRKKKNPEPGLFRPSKEKIKKQFKNFIRGKINSATVNQLCEWLVKHVEENPEPSRQPSMNSL